MVSLPRRGDLRVGQWNINGVRTQTHDKLADSAVCEWIQSMDIAAFTETHLEAGQGLPIQGYRVFEANRNRNKAASRCSGGVAIAVRRKLAKGVERIPCPSTEMVWVRLNAAFFGLHRDIALGVVYEGPCQSPVVIRDNKDAFAAVQRQLGRLPTGVDVLMLGDMNARTKMWSELIDVPQSARQPLECLGVECDVLPDQTRLNQDIASNGNGRPFIDLCRRNELVILNGRTFGDARGMCTSFQSSGHSLVDYAVAAAPLLPRISKFVVGALCGDVSDHAPIEVTLRVALAGHASRGPVVGASGGTGVRRVHWQEDAAPRFRRAMETPVVADALESIRSSLLSNPDRRCIDAADVFFRAFKYASA